MEENSNPSFKVKPIIRIFSLVMFFASLVLIWSGSQPPQLQPVTKIENPVVTVVESKTDQLGIEGESTVVEKVVDGDTIEVSGNRKVRYIGIDTPETVDPRRPVGCFGKEASDENKQLVEGKTVILVKDVSDTDKFNRLLRYVYTKNDDGSLLFVNDYLVKNGFAKASTYPPDIKFQEQFLKSEAEARNSFKGLWQKCQ
jgi:micrococcal nuclease